MSATITAFPRSAGTHGILPAEAVHTASSPRAQSPMRPRLHITRRGRAVLSLGVALAVVATIVAVVLSGGGAVATSTSGDVHFSHITVAAGETLWQVAEDVAPSSDPRDVIADIQQLNNLGTTQVMPGQSLAIPLKYAQK
jgi:hypothetical protein